MLDDSSITTAFSQIESHVGTIDGIVHSVAFADKDELQGEYVDTTREGYLLAQESSSYSLVAVAREAKRMMKTGGSIVTSKRRVRI